MIRMQCRKADFGPLRVQKPFHIISRTAQSGIFVLILLLLTGCAGHKAFSRGEDLLKEGRYHEAVAKFYQAVNENPDRHEYRMKLQTSRSLAALEHLKRGQNLIDAGDLRRAEEELIQAVGLDPGLEKARQKLGRISDLLKVQKLISEAESFYNARRFTPAKNNLLNALQLDVGNPRAIALLQEVQEQSGTVIEGYELDVQSDKPITLKFKKTPTRDVFGILSRLSGINFIFDSDLRAGEVSVLLEDATFAQALELLLKMNDLGKKVLNSKTIIIYPRSRNKDQQYQDQIIRTFYLSHIDAKKAVNMLRTMLQLRKIYVHEELNALVIRDNSDTLRLVERIIEASDRADSEVVFDLELLEVSHGSTLNFGPKLSSYSIGVGLGEGGTIVSQSLSSGSSTENLVSSFSSLESFYTLPTAAFDFAKTLTDSEILANPKIRVKNKDKAKVHVGTREPIITVTTIGDGNNISENIQYVDVGVKLDVEPVIELDNTIVTKLALEVSSVSDRRETQRGTVALTITTTNAQTTLSLKDGEQTVIGGLMRDDFSHSKNGFAFLSDLPILGNLITSHRRDKQKREILLSITPHIVRSVDLPRPDVANIWSGTEDDLKAGASFGSFADSFEPETKRVSGPAAPGLKDPPVIPKVDAPEALPLESEGPPGVAPKEISEPGPIPEISEVPQPGFASSPFVEEGVVFWIGPERIGKGEEAVYEVVVDGAENIYSAPLFIDYDPGKLEFVRAKEGQFLQSLGKSAIFNPDPEKGRIAVGLNLDDKQEKYGTGTLFQVTFRGREPGIATLKLERPDFSNNDGNGISVTTLDYPIEVY